MHDNYSINSFFNNNRDINILQNKNNNIYKTLLS